MYQRQSSATLGGNPTATGGAGNYSYIWVNLNGGANPSAIANPTVSPLSTTLYQVWGTDANGCAGSDQVMVNVTTARLNSSDDLEISMYPNPTSALINVVVRSNVTLSGVEGSQLRTDLPATIQVFDVVGKLVYRWKGESEGTFIHPIDLSGNAEGQYLVKISVDGKAESRVISLVK